MDIVSTEFWHVQQEDPDDINDFQDLEPLSHIERDIVAHIAGISVKPLLSTIASCTVRTEALTAAEVGEEHALVQMKGYVHGSRNLIYVSRDVLSLAECWESAFKKFSEENDICRLKSPMRTLTHIFENEHLHCRCPAVTTPIWPKGWSCVS